MTSEGMNWLRPSAVDSRSQIGALVLNCLESANGSAKLDPVLGVLHHHLQDFFRPAYYIGALQDGGPAVGWTQERGCAAHRPKGRIGPQSYLAAPYFVLPISANGRHGGCGETGRARIYQK